MTRRKCPRERAAKGGACERSGCDHLAPKGSRVCGCCLVQLGQLAFDKIAVLRRIQVKSSQERRQQLEAEALEALSKLPPRNPIGTGWPGLANTRDRARKGAT